MNLKNLLQEAIVKLKEAGIEEAGLKAKLAIGYVLGKPKEYFLLHGEDEISLEDSKKIIETIDKLEKNIPIEHITNTREFMKLNFYVNENVLIPRQDTEILVEEVIKRCKRGKILDLCTGSGAIAISLAKYIPDSVVFASDVSLEALEIAKKNASDNNVNVSFIESDMLKNIKERSFDVIVSNPPYIETGIINTLPEDVKKEPRIALDGGTDGLDFYRIIAKEAKEYLKQGGLLALEIGYNQAEAVMNLLSDYYHVEVVKDLAGNNRVIIAFSI